MNIKPKPDIIIFDKLSYYPGVFSSTTGFVDDVPESDRLLFDQFFELFWYGFVQSSSYYMYFWGI